MSEYVLKNKNKVMVKLKAQKVLFLMVLPAFVAYLIFGYLPLLGWSLAFVKYRPGFNLFQCKFVGLDQFTYFFTQTNDAIMLFRNTIVINLLSTIFTFFLAAIFAIMISELRSKYFSRAVQMVSLFPFFLSWIIVYSLAFSLFSVQSGAINTILMNLGWIKEPINVFGSAAAAWPLMIGLTVWKSVGYFSVIFLASIISIPLEEFEAAAIDGASRIQKICFITIPHLKQVFFVMLILQFGSLLSSNLEQFYAFTNSQNWNMMVVFDMYAYKYGLQLGDYSYATAVGIIKTIISMLILFLVNSLSKKYADESVF
jgi:putative aldouronate transport system permease protein